jgi:hypothetical protein
MRLPRVRPMVSWGTRYLAVGFCIGLVMPFFTGGPASMLFRLSPLLGAAVGAVFGVVGGALRDIISSRGKEKTVTPESEVELRVPNSPEAIVTL